MTDGFGSMLCVEWPVCWSAPEHIGRWRRTTALKKNKARRSKKLRYLPLIDFPFTGNSREINNGLKKNGHMIILYLWGNILYNNYITWYKLIFYFLMVFYHIYISNFKDVVSFQHSLNILLSSDRISCNGILLNIYMTTVVLVVGGWRGSLSCWVSMPDDALAPSLLSSCNPFCCSRKEILNLYSYIFYN